MLSSCWRHTDCVSADSACFLLSDWSVLGSQYSLSQGDFALLLSRLLSASPLPDWLIVNFLSAGPRSADSVTLSGPLMGVQPAACRVLKIDDNIQHLLPCSLYLLYAPFLSPHFLSFFYCPHFVFFPCLSSFLSFLPLLSLFPLLSPFIVSSFFPFLSCFVVSSPSLVSFPSFLLLFSPFLSHLFSSCLSSPFLPRSLFISLSPLLVYCPFPSFFSSPCLLSSPSLHLFS